MKDGKTIFAIVGYGGMGTQHHRQLGKVEGALVKGVWDILPARLAAARDAGAIAYGGFEEILRDPEIDIVLVATPNDTHPPIVVAALEAGKNVICEKPAAISAAEFEKMAAAEKRSGKLLVVHQNRRWDPDFLTVKRIVDEGTIGRVYRVESRIHGSRGIPGDWRRLKEKGGGMVLDWGVHLLDRLLLLFPKKVKRVYCELSFISGKEVDDGFDILLELEDGTSILAEVGTCNYIMLPKWYICGTKGSAVIEDWDMNGHIVKLVDERSADVNPIVAGAGFTKTMAVRNDETIARLPLPPVSTDEKDFYRNVMAAIKDEADPIVRNDQVMRVMRLVDAAFLSARKGQAVSFE
jgi:scyllo-inositol 2-dehydrogenase (NADP+)